MILENIADAPLDCIQFENDLIIHALEIQDTFLANIPPSRREHL